MTLPGVVFVVFLVLKLTHVIDWSWWLVTLPLWAGLAVFLVCMLLAAMGMSLSKMWGKVE